MFLGDRLALALLVATCTACGSGVVQVGRFGTTTRVAASPEALCEQLSRAALANGQALVAAQPARGRFAVRAHFADAFGPYTFAVECSPRGFVTVRPYGPRVEPLVSAGFGADLLPAALSHELTGFTNNIRAELRRLESGGAPWAQSPPPRSLLRDPLPGELAGIHADRGIVATGGLSLAASYLTGAFASFALGNDCGSPYDNCEIQASFAFVPFAHWVAGFGNSSTRIWAFVTGISSSILEIVSIIVLFAGAAHHRSGPVTLSGPGSLTISF